MPGQGVPGGGPGQRTHSSAAALVLQRPSERSSLLAVFSRRCVEPGGVLKARGCGVWGRGMALPSSLGSVILVAFSDLFAIL